MRRLAALCLLLALPVVTSCSAIDRDWAGTAPPLTANPNAVLAGKWEGSWQSDATAYSGNLKAVIVPTDTTTQEEGPATKYHAEIKMSLFEPLFEMFSNDQALILNATPGLDGRIHFKGQIDRGQAFGGIHHYDGYIDGDVFFCDYTSDQDCGTFLMHRLTLENQSH